jgi:hypothetical protein
VLLPITLEVIPTPGAKISKHVPKLLKDARLSVESVAPTVIALGALEGDDEHAFALLFPAATATTTPSATRAATALLSAAENPPPKLMFATAGPET